MRLPPSVNFKSSTIAVSASAQSVNMDLDIEMDVDVDEGQYNAPIPEAYTHDIITGEEQVRTRGSGV